MYKNQDATVWLQDVVAASPPVESNNSRAPMIPLAGLAAMGCAVITLLLLLASGNQRQVVLGVLTGIVTLALAVLTVYQLRNGKLAAQRPQQPQQRTLKWGQVLAYLQAYPILRQNVEDNAALAALNAAHRIAQTDAWRNPLLDKYAARIDMFAELHAVLDAAQDIAAVRVTVGEQPPDAYAHQWQIDTDALDRLGAQVQRRADVLLQYEATIMRVQSALDDIAHQNHRRAAASAVDNLVQRRGGDDLATEIAADRAAEADAAEAAVRVHLEAAHTLKTAFDQPFSITR